MKKLATFGVLLIAGYLVLKNAPAFAQDAKAAASGVDGVVQTFQGR